MTADTTGSASGNAPGPDIPGGGEIGPEAAAPGRRKRRVWWLYARVMLVQLVALIALWFLQSAYGT